MERLLNSFRTINTCDMHTAGEPLRIILSGYPPLNGNSLLEKRKYAMENMDSYRKLLMFEPRGHYDMYGVIITEADNKEDADFAVLFTHNEGYSTMCGHAIIALGRYAIDSGMVIHDGQTQKEVKIQCPCGIVKAFVDCNNEMTGHVKFHSVPAFVYKLDVEVNVPNHGKLRLDIAFGGAFYAILPADLIGLNVNTSSIAALVSAATAITEATKKQIEIKHPVHEELSFLYGTILTDGLLGSKTNFTTNICVYAKSAVDRSPTGSGVTARMALMYERKLINKGETCNFKSVIGSCMTGRVVNDTSYEGFPSVIIEVGGQAFYTGMHKFVLENGDPFTEGFLLRP